jgi:serine/threonine protein kinase
MDQAVDSFLKTVLRSGLLNRDQLRSALRNVPREQRQNPQNLADHLIKLGKLSRFQAYKLLQGAAFGLMLGPYQILAPIGRGGMGSVYLALDTRTQARLAVKVLPPKKARQEERYLARFRREMDLSQRVRHDHLARTFDVGVFQGVNYIAMEYIPGLSLHRLVGRQGPLPVARAARLFAEVCSGLEHAHEQGLVHRDLKPSNIMVTPNNHAKILDLGLAMMEGEVEDDIEVIGGQGYVVGSMDFIAPEQTEDSTRVDARADIYSLGCSLYYAVTGQPPFPGGKNRDKIRRHRHEEPEPLTRLNPSVPDEFAALVARMMDKSPERRFASAYDARGELLAWAAAEPELPLDQQGDRTFQDAVIALESADVTSDMIGDVVILKADGAGTPEPSSSLLTSLMPEDSRQPDYLWVIWGLVAFWIVVLGGLGVMVLLH